jgi:hypothetical protein
MSNVLLCHTNRTDLATLSNGSWSATLPLANLKDGNVNKAARSTNALAASTIFAVDMGPVPFPIRAVALVNHNLTTAATWQVKGGTAAPDASNNFASGQVFDSGVMNVKQLTFNWDVPTNWGASYMALYAFNAQTVRYVTVTIADASNPAGYVQLGRLFIGTGFQPAVNFNRGAVDAWDDFSTMTRSKSGSPFFSKVQPRQRFAEFTLGMLSAAESTQVHEMDGFLGITDEILYVPDPADMAYSQRFGFLGTNRELTPLEYLRYPERSKAYRIEQKV